MSFLYQNIIYKPIFNALVFLYENASFGDIGIAIILLTILIRIILYPLFHKSAVYQKRMQNIQPKIKAIQDKHKHNKDKTQQTQEMLAIYKEENLNPFSGFFLILVQLPILFALYRIFLNIFKPESFDNLYSFIPKPESLNPDFLGLINLSENSILLVVLAALLQYLQAKLALSKHVSNPDSMADRMSKQMVFMGPILTVIVFYKFPAAIALYWAVASLFSVFQQIIINKKLNNG